MPIALFIGFLLLGGVAIALTVRREPGAAPGVTESSADGDLFPASTPAMAGPAVQAPDILSTVSAAVSGTLKKLFELPARALQYAEAIGQTEARYGIPASLLARLLYQESRFRPEVIDGRVRSSAGAMGIAQFMPATARELGIDPLNPLQAIDGAGRYLRQLYDRLGAWDRALAAYNWGIGNLQRRGLDRAPPETRDYITQILNDVDIST